MMRSRHDRLAIRTDMPSSKNVPITVMRVSPSVETRLGRTELNRPSIQGTVASIEPSVSVVVIASGSMRIPTDDSESASVGWHPRVSNRHTMLSQRIKTVLQSKLDTSPTPSDGRLASHMVTFARYHHTVKPSSDEITKLSRLRHAVVRGN